MRWSHNPVQRPLNATARFLTRFLSTSSLMLGSGRYTLLILSPHPEFYPLIAFPAAFRSNFHQTVSSHSTLLTSTTCQVISYMSEKYKNIRFLEMSYAKHEDGERSMPEGALSPRRALSLSRERASVSILARDLQDNLQHEESQRRQGAKPAEVHGFVGAICTIVATAIFFVWAYFPEVWLHSVGITYYPSRYWALAVPAYMIVAVIFVWCAYISLNHISTPPPQSFNTLFDKHTREPIANPIIPDNVEKPIHPISDVPIIEVNDLLFGKATPKRRTHFVSDCGTLPTGS